MNFLTKGLLETPTNVHSIVKLILDESFCRLGTHYHGLGLCQLAVFSRVSGSGKHRDPRSCQTTDSMARYKPYTGNTQPQLDTQNILYLTHGEHCVNKAEGSESEEEILLQGTLLDGLPNWLDRLFEGSTRRYYINYWPDFPTK
ncbi:lethal (3) 80Fg [Carabus blaptoides fortunei]